MPFEPGNRYQVFNGKSDVVVYHVKRKLALEWVSRGLAVEIGERQIRMITPNREIVRTSDSMKSSGQNDAYELAGIEPFCQFVQGGGVNGIRRQLRVDRFSGAKVGHQT